MWGRSSACTGGCRRGRWRSRSCSQGRSRWRRGMCCMGLRRCWCTRRATGCMVYAGPDDRRVCADAREHADAGEGAVLQRERSQRATGRRGMRTMWTGCGTTGYSSRYIGSLVADFHRTLLKGGVFLYPPTRRSRAGSCGCCTRRIRWRLLRSRRAGWRRAERAGFLRLCRRRFISERRLWWEASARWKRL